MGNANWHLLKRILAYLSLFKIKAKAKRVSQTAWLEKMAALEDATAVPSASNPKFKKNKRE